VALACACGGSEPSPSEPAAIAPEVIDQPPVKIAASREPPPWQHPCAPGETPSAAWRFALIGGPFEPAQTTSREALVAKWRAGAIAASDDTAAALAGVLGERGAGAQLLDARAPVARGWAIVPAHELSPAWSVIAVDGAHPLAGDGALAVPVCDARGNIDPAKLTTLVMSGTTALTGRTAERIDDTGVRGTIGEIAPFFTSADLVHLSNEVAFVRDCHPRTGQQPPRLKFCARDRYIDLLAALRPTIIELTGSHLTDYGRRSMARTIRMYEQRGWLWFGGGRTQLEASEPRLVEHHGNRLAFVGCNAVNWWVKAIDDGLGTANCDWARMAWQLQDLRRRGYLPIASVQHRELRTHTPARDLVRDLRGLAEAGALFVLGSQAHVAHPWEVHYGAYVHYGPGNLLFAQYREEQREASVDKLYIHDGALLTVDHVYVRTEHGQPRQLRAAERRAFLAELAAAAAAIPPPDPWARPTLPTLARERPDSLVVHGRAQRLTVTVPAHVEAGQRYPLVVDLAGTEPARDDAFVVRRVGGFIVKRKRRPRGAASADDIADFMRAKYPIDPRAIQVNDVRE